MAMCCARLQENTSGSALFLTSQGCHAPDTTVPSLLLYWVGFGSVSLQWSHRVCEPLVGRDPASCLAALGFYLVLTQGNSWPGKMFAWVFYSL